MFILENVITIAICLGMILVFRHADKNNRTLEKVKKYSDKQKDEFSAFVDSKTKALENMSVDVGVAIDRAGAALTALRDAQAKLAEEERGLAARREQVAEFAKKIGRIDQTVASLADAIAGADKSLSKLAQDSDFAESLAKKMQEAKKEFQDISMQIGQLEQRFSRENGAALASLREDVLSDIQAGVNDIQERTSRTMREAADIEARTKESLQRVFNNVVEKASESVNGIAAAKAAAISEIKAGLGKISASVESASQEAANAEARTKEGLQVVLRSLAEKAEEETAAIAAARDGALAEMQAGLDKISAIAESAAKDAANAETIAQESLQSALSGIAEKASAETAAIAAARDGALAEMQARLNQIDAIAERAAEDAASAETRARESLQMALDALADKAAENGAALAAAREDIASGVQAGLDKIAARVESAEVEADNIESRTRADLQGICGDILGKAADDAAALAAAQQAELAEMQAALAEIKEESERIAREAANVEAISRESVQRICDAIVNKATDDARALAAEQQKAQTDIQATLDEMHEHIEGIDREAASIEDRAKESMQRVFDSIAEKASESAAAIGDAKESALGEMQARLNQLSEMAAAATQDAAAAEDKARESLQAVLDTLAEKAAENGAALDAARESIASDVQAGLDKVAARVESADREAASIEARARTSLQDICDAIVSKATDDADALAAAQQKTQSEIQASLDEMNERVAQAEQKAAEMQSRLQESLQSIYDSIASEAAGRAGAFEDEAYAALKQQSEERLASHKQEIDASTADILQKAKDELAESRKLLAGFKEELSRESDALLDKTRSDMQAFAANVREEAEQSKREQESFFAERRSEQVAFFQKIKDETDGIATSSAKAVQEAEKRLSELDTRIAGFEKASDGQLARFRDILDEIPVIDSRIRASIQDTENKSSAALELFTQDQNTRRDKFEAAFNARVESLMNKVQNLENAIAELKAHAYANVSEKIKIFEDDFFSDLKERTDAMSAEMNSWQGSIEKKLAEISAESEAMRTNAENEYTEALKARVSEIEAAFREQASKTESSIRDAESEMQKRIAENASGLQSFTEQYRADFQQAREDAAAFARRELQVYSANLQESMRVQQLEIENRYKELASAVDAERESAETLMSGIKDDIADWQRKNEKAVEAAASAIDAKIEDFRGSSSTMIANVEANAQSEFSAAVTRLGRDTDALRAQVVELREKIDTAGKDLDTRSAAALENFAKSFQAFSEKAASQAKEAQEQSESAALSLKAQGAEISASLEETRQKLFAKINNDVNSVSDSLDEIAARIKAFEDQSRVFARADELKGSLENSIEKLKIEAGNLNVYEEEMARLKSQYQQIREMSGDAEQKLSQVAADKKRIDGLENNFNLLIDIYKRTEEQISEMTRTKDDVLDYQARIRRFEESLNKMDERYDRVERKSLTIDQTLSNADKAFESLKELEKSLKDFRERTATVPADLDAIQTKVNGLLENSERVGEIESKITQLESELLDTEKRAKRIQDDRKSFVNTEKRLIDLKNDADKAIGLFRALSRSDDAPREREKGAPSFEIKSYVKDLKHKGWAIDEIAKNMKLSKSEVEMILDEPD